MQKQSANPYVQWYQQNRVLVWGAAAAAAVSLYVYRSACSEQGSAHKKQRPLSQFQQIRKAINDYSAAATALGDTVQLVSNDIRQFLTSDATELPQSLRQLNKLLQSPELQTTVSTCAASVVRGVTEATSCSATQDGACGAPLLGTVLEAVFSERGRGLIGMAVGVATRNATVTVCEFIERRMEAAASSSGASGSASSSFSTAIKDLIASLSSGQGEQLLSALLTKSVRAAITSYVDATRGSNMVDGLLASLSKQQNRDALTDIVGRIAGALCREVGGAYRSSGASSSSPSSFPSSAAQHASPAFAACHGREGISGFQVTSTSGSCQAPTQIRPRPGGRSPLPPGAMHLLDGGPAGFVAAPVSAHPDSGLPANVPPAWLLQVVELLRVRELRSLAVDVVCAASREGTRGAVQGFLQSTAVGPSDAAGGASSPVGAGSGSLAVLQSVYGGSATYKMYVLATLAVSLCTYALSPRAALLL